MAKQNDPGKKKKPSKKKLAPLDRTASYLQAKYKSKNDSTSAVRSAESLMKTRRKGDAERQKKSQNNINRLEEIIKKAQKNSL